MKISNMTKIFKLAQASGDSVHMAGLHGIGKSKVVEQYCKENDIHLEILMLSQNEVADLIGMPVEKDGVTYWSKPVWLKRMEDASAQGKQCCLFLDELARAPLEVRQSALQLVLDHRIHEHHLPVDTMGLETLVIGADNPSDEYQTDELDPALLDRFMTYKVETDVKGWLKWARANNIESVITDFLADFPDKLHWMAEDQSEDKGATPRAWAKLSDIMKNFNLIPENMQLSVIESKIGQTVGASFFQFYVDYAKVMKVEDVLKAIGKAKIETREQQEKVAEKIGKMTKEMEQISASELAQKIKAEIESGENPKVTYDVLTTYLASLNMEIMQSIYKTWKEDPDTEEFYYEWARNVPDRWVFRIVTEKVF